MNDHADPVIAARGLIKRFGPVTAVAGVDFDVQTGELFGFLGPNGAGKTTTIRMLTGVLEPSDGTATIQDHDIRTEALLSRAHLGVVPEEANVYLDLTVWRNLMLMAELHGVPRRQRVSEGERLLEVLGLADRKLHKARALSKGLRQRLMLCAALVTGPEILFLDEPTSGLDVASARLIRQIVRKLNDDGLTVFLTTHNMDEAGGDVLAGGDHQPGPHRRHRHARAAPLSHAIQPVRRVELLRRRPTATGTGGPARRLPGAPGGKRRAAVQRDARAGRDGGRPAGRGRGRRVRVVAGPAACEGDGSANAEGLG